MVTRVQSGRVMSTGIRQNWPLVALISQFVSGMLKPEHKLLSLTIRTVDSLPLLKVSTSRTVAITLVSRHHTV